eukprot:5490066-Pyramimonas_sp.AAC.1
MAAHAFELAQQIPCCCGHVGAVSRGLDHPRHGRLHGTSSGDAPLEVLQIIGYPAVSGGVRDPPFRLPQWLISGYPLDARREAPGAIRMHRRA